MPAQEIKPISYGTVTLNDATRSVFFLRGHGLHDNTPPSIVSVERIGQFPTYVRTQPGPGKMFVLSIFPTSDSAAVIDALRPVFDPARQDSPILVIEDENGVTKLCPTVPQGMYYQDGGWWEAPVWAPKPDWVSAAVNTHTVVNLADVLKTFSPAIVNDGDGIAFPHVTIIAPQAKKTAWGGWEKMWELTFAWRSEFPATSPGSGTWLLEVTDGGIHTANIVDVSAITTDCTTTVASGDTMTRASPKTITVTSTAGWDTKGILLATDTEEQFEYEVINGTTIELTARALGGTAAVTHTATFTIHQSRMLKNGDDIAVFINNVQVPPEKINLVGMDTSSTKIWVEFSQGPGSTAILENVGDGTGSETEFVLDREKPDWKVGDYLVRDSASADEQLRITTIDGLNLTVVRGVRNSPSGSVAEGDVLWKVDTHFQVAYNSSIASVRPTNPDPPLINMTLSTNLQWEWTTAPIWSGSSRSAGAWIRGLYAGEVVKPYRLQKYMALDDDGTSIRFTDTAPSAAKPNFDMVEFVAACGIKDADGDIQWDASMGFPFSINIIGKDLQGIETLLSENQGHAANSHHFPVVYTNQNENPDEILSGVIFQIRNCIVTGMDQTLSTPETVMEPALTDGTDAQSFTLDDDTEVMGVIMRFRNTGTTGDFPLQLNKAASGGGVGAAIWGPQVHNEASGSTHYVCFWDGRLNRPTLEAGVYFLAFAEEAGGAPSGRVTHSNSPRYTRGSRWEWENGGGPNIYVDQISSDLVFFILSQTADNQPEAETWRTEEEVTINDIKIVFDTARIPMVAKQADEDAYYMDTSIVQGNAEEMRIRFLDRWADIDGFSVSITLPARVVTASRYQDKIRSILTVQTDSWMLFKAGSNTVSAIPNLEAVDEDLTIQFRDLWQ